MKTAAIILAAGQSRRFGGDDKLLASFQGKPLCQHGADTLRCLDVDMRIAAISTPQVGAIFDGFHLVNSTGDQSNSLGTSVKRARDHGMDRVIICLADMPFITSTYLSRLLCSQGDIIAATTRDGTSMVPAVFGRSHFDKIIGLTGDRGARALLNDATTITEIPITPLMQVDIDTPQNLDDYASRDLKHTDFLA